MLAGAMFPRVLIRLLVGFNSAYPIRLISSLTDMQGSI